MILALCEHDSYQGSALGHGRPEVLDRYNVLSGSNIVRRW